MKSVFTIVFAALLMMGMSPQALASDSAKEAKDSFGAAADETGDGALRDGPGQPFHLGVAEQLRVGTVISTRRGTVR